MDLGLKGKTAIVTAASKGIGRAIAHGLAAEGTNVVMGSRDQAAIESAAAAIRSATGANVVALTADVTREADNRRIVDTAVERFGSIDILINNAGGPKPGQFATLNDADWQAGFELTLMSVVRLTRLCVPHMRQRGGGRIINVESSSVKVPIDNLLLSNSIRSAVIGLAKTLSLELAGDNILVNTVCPGRIHTDRIDQLDRVMAERSGQSFEAVRTASVAAIPLGRLGTPEEFANMVVFLASEPASYITGVTICVDGGATKAVY